MPTHHDPHRQNRIEDEILTDAYDAEEQAMGWYYYFADNLELPIPATVRLPVRGEKAEKVEVDPESETGAPLRLGISEKGSRRVQYISPEAIVSLDTSPENVQIINDWLYWHNHKLLPGEL